MAQHWTYDDCDVDTDLEQGDILQPSAALRDVFADVHPHFQDDKYLGFMVGTQSCDLVRRGGTPKATYVHLAVIRPLAQVTHKLLAYVSAPVAPGAFRRTARGSARQFFERLLNQNEQATGLFFLYPDADLGIGEAAVVFLRVGVSLRSEHYDTIRAARIGRLKPEFRAKLGWLIGNLYVRPATPDWGDVDGGKKRAQDLVAQYLDEARWIDDELVEEAIASGVDLTSTSDEALEAFRPPSRLDRAVEEVSAELARVIPAVNPADVKKVQNRLRSNAKFRKLFRHDATSA